MRSFLTDTLLEESHSHLIDLVNLSITLIKKEYIRDKLGGQRDSHCSCQVVYRRLAGIVCLCISYNYTEHET
jgi:hypothetical protein